MLNTCPLCGREFWQEDPFSWVYAFNFRVKTNNHKMAVCSYSCYRSLEKDPKLSKKLLAERKAKYIENMKGKKKNGRI